MMNAKLHVTSTFLRKVTALLACIAILMNSTFAAVIAVADGALPPVDPPPAATVDPGHAGGGSDGGSSGGGDTPAAPTPTPTVDPGHVGDGGTGGSSDAGAGGGANITPTPYVTPSPTPTHAVTDGVTPSPTPTHPVPTETVADAGAPAAGETASPTPEFTPEPTPEPTPFVGIMMLTLSADELYLSPDDNSAEITVDAHLNSSPVSASISASSDGSLPTPIVKGNKISLGGPFAAPGGKVHIYATCTVPEGTFAAEADVFIHVSEAMEMNMMAGFGAMDFGINGLGIMMQDTNTLMTFMNNSVSMILNDFATPADGAVITGYTATNGSHGSVSITGNKLTYTPNTDWFGTDTFVLTATDSLGNTAECLCTVIVKVTNRAPVVAATKTLTTPQDTAVSFSIATPGFVSDPDGDPLTYEVSGATNGTVAISGTNIVFTPAANFYGTASFTFTATDPSWLTASCQFTVDVTFVNYPPVVTSFSMSATEDTAATEIDLNSYFSDANGDFLTYAITTQCANGTAAINNGHMLAFMPSPDFYGNTSFVVTASDGNGGATPFTVPVTVTGVNDPPVFSQTAIDATIDEDTPYSIVLNTILSDVDNTMAQLTVTVAGNPAHGTVSITGTSTKTLTYTPSKNYNGSDTFTITAKDSSNAMSTNQCAFSITIDPVDDAPEMSSTFTGTCAEDTFYTKDLQGFAVDPEGAEVTYTLVSGTSAKGFPVTLVGTTLTYTPGPDFEGADTFVVRASDGGLTSNCTFTINVTPVNDIPVMQVLTVTGGTSEEVPYVYNLLSTLATDVDLNDVLTYFVGTAPSHGTVSIAADGKSLTYTPATRFSGVDTFTIRVKDKVNAQAVDGCVFTINVSNVNHAPDMQITNVTGIINEDAVYTYTTLDSLAVDIDAGDSITYYVNPAKMPAHGAVAIAGDGKSLTYTPVANYNGSDTFEILAKDGFGLVSPLACKFTITVNPVNDAPVMGTTAVTGTILEDSVYTYAALSGLATDVDAGDTITYFVGTNPAHGTLVIAANGKSLTYTPAANFNGVDTFTILAKDNANTVSAEGCVFTINVTPVFDDVILQNKNYTIDKQYPDSVELTLDVLDTATCADTSDTPPYVIQIDAGSVSVPSAGGSVRLNAERTAILYTPNLNWSGSETFTYSVSHGGKTVSATVSINIPLKNYTPIFSGLNSFYEIEEDSGAFTVNFTLQDDTTALSVLMVQGAPFQNGSLLSSYACQAVNAAQGKYKFTLTPGPDKFGLVKIRLSASDGFDIGTYEFSVDITPVNDKPVAIPFDVTTFEDEQLIFPLAAAGRASDVDNNFSELVFAMDPSTLVPAGAGTIVFDGVNCVFTPSQDWNGTCKFSFWVNDGQLDSDKAFCTINVTPVNNPPYVADIPGQPLILTEDTLYGPIQLDISDLETATRDLTVSIYSSNPGVLNAGGLVYNAATQRLTMMPLPDANWPQSKGTPIIVYVTVSDGNAATTKTIEVYVEGTEDLPRANPDEYYTDDGLAVAITPLDNDNDVDGDALYVTIDSFPGPGTLSLASGTAAQPISYLYTPPVGFQGDVVIHYTANDGHSHAGDTSASKSTITIHVTMRNTELTIYQVAPYFQSVSDVDRPFNETLKILNIPLGASCALTATIASTTNTSLIKNLSVDSPVVGNGGEMNANLGFTIAKDMIGEAYIRVRAQYTVGTETKSDEMLFRVLVVTVNNPPVPKDYGAIGAEVEMNIGDNMVFNVIADTTDDVLPKDVKIVSVERVDVDNGTLSLNTAAGTLSYHAVGGSGYGPWYDTIQYTMMDGGGLTAVGTIRIKILPVDRAPTAHDDLYIFPSSMVNQNVTLTGTGTAPGTSSSGRPLSNDYDVDGMPDTGTLRFAGIPGGWTLSGDKKDVSLTLPSLPGRYTYTYQCESTRNGTDWKQSNTATITIIIMDPNDPNAGGLDNMPAAAYNGTYYITEDEVANINFSGLIRGYNTTGTLDMTITGGNSYVSAFSHTPSGAVTGNNYSFSLTPVADVCDTANGVSTKTITISYTVDNGYTGTVFPVSMSTATITLHITPVNDAPQISVVTGPNVGSEYHVAKGESLVLDVLTTDVDNVFAELPLGVASSNEVSINSMQTQVVRGANGHWTVTVFGGEPVAAPIILTFTTSDGWYSATTTLPVYVVAGNPPSVLTIPTQVIKEDTSASFKVVTDVNNPTHDVLTLKLKNTVPASVGTVYTQGNREVTFIPAGNFFHENQADVVEIQYTLTNSNGMESAMGTLSVHVQPVNDAPQIYGVQRTAITREDTPMTLTFTVVDMDRGFVVNPALQSDTDDAIVTRTGVLNITGLSTDAAMIINPVTIVPVLGSAHTYSVTANVVPFLDAHHANDADTTDVTFTASQPTPGLSSNAVCKVHITSVNDLPRLIDGNGNPVLDGNGIPVITAVLDSTTPEDTLLVENLVSRFIDPEGTAIKLTRVAPVQHGSVSNVNGKANYMPLPKDYFTPVAGALDSEYGLFEFSVADEDGGIFSGKVKVRITPVNDAPEAHDVLVSTQEDTPLTFLLASIANVTDVDNLLSELTFELLTQPTNGTAVLYTTGADKGKVLYTPNLDFDGVDTFRYRVSDGSLTSEADIKVTVIGVNDPPYITFDNGSAGWETDKNQGPVTWYMAENETKTFAFNAIDEGGSPLCTFSVSSGNALLPNATTYSLGSSGGHRTVTFKPTANVNGTVVVTLTAKDNEGATSSRTVTLVVTPVNKAPEFLTASPINIVMSEDGAAQVGSIVATDMETPAASLDLKLVNGASLVSTITDDLGTLRITGITYASNRATLSYSFTPKADMFGAKTYTLRLTDNGDPAGNPPAGNTDAAPKSVDFTINVTVNPVNDAPSNPSNVTLNSAIYSKMAGFNQVVVNWTASNDLHTGREETPAAAITYTVQYATVSSPATALNSANWTTVATGVTGTSHTFTIPAALTASTATLRVRVYATDDGTLGNDVDGTPSSPLKGTPANCLAAAVSAAVKFDNAVPSWATATQSPSTTWTNQNVTFTLGASDSRAYDAGILSIDPTFTLPATLTPVTPGAGLPTTQYTTSVNGTFTFTATDKVDNKTAVHTVTVNKIDRIKPKVTFASVAPANGESFAGQDLIVKLSYADVADSKTPANGGDATSGMSTTGSLYLLSTSGSLSNPTLTSTYSTSGINLKGQARGTWYVYAQAVDNAGNKSDVEKFGPYTVLNNVPVLSQPANQVFTEDCGTKTLNVPFTDADGMALDYTGKISYTPSAVFPAGSITVARGTGANNDKLIVTFVPVAEMFDPNNASLSVTLTVTDDQGAFDFKTFTVRVTPVNDVPSDPTNVTITNVPKQFMAGNVINISWTASSDVHGAVTETPATDLKYTIYYAFNGHVASPNWVQAGSVTGVTSTTLAAPGGDTGAFAVRVVCTDDGNLGLGETGKGSPMSSAGNNKSAVAKLDNTAPKLTGHSYSKTWWNTSATLTLNVQDMAGIGDPVGTSPTGLLATGGIVLCNANGSTPYTGTGITATGNQTQYTVTTNGTYYFLLKDIVGNVSAPVSVTVTNYDIKEPAVAPDWPNLTQYWNANGASITLTFKDDPDLPTSARSGLKSAAYKVVVQGVNPDSVPWIDITTLNPGDASVQKTVTIIDRGKWNIYAKVEDQAGNTITKTFGIYHIQNNPPKIITTPVEGAMCQNDTYTFQVQVYDPDDDPNDVPLVIFDTTDPSTIPMSGISYSRSAPGSDIWNVTLTPLPDAENPAGLYIKMKATDPAPYSETGYYDFKIRVLHENKPPKVGEQYQKINYEEIAEAYFYPDDSADKQYASPSFTYSKPTDTRYWPTYGTYSVNRVTGQTLYAPYYWFTGMQECWVEVKEAPVPDTWGNTNRNYGPNVKLNPDGTFTVMAKFTISVIEPKRRGPHGPGGGLNPFFMNLGDYEIPLGSAAAFASLEGLTIDEVSDELGRQLYTDEELFEIFDSAFQMMLPFNFDEIKWKEQPRTGLKLRILAKGVFNIGDLYIRQVEENGVPGYNFHYELLPGVLSDPEAAGINFTPTYKNVQIIETQYAKFDDEQILRMDTFIPASLLQGKGNLYVSVPCMFVAEEAMLYSIPDDMKLNWQASMRKLLAEIKEGPTVGMEDNKEKTISKEDADIATEDDKEKTLSKEEPKGGIRLP